MHLLAVNYYVHRPFTQPVNPKGKVKSIANTWPSSVIFRAFLGHESARAVFKHAQILSLGRLAFRIFYMRVVN
jgi:hypothetical protein